MISSIAAFSQMGCREAFAFRIHIVPLYREPITTASKGWIFGNHDPIDCQSSRLID